MRGKLLLKYSLLLTGGLIVGTLSAPLSGYLLKNYLPNGSNDWIGFAGNIVGGILGGFCTLLGVAYAFNLENNKAFKETIPTKIVNLYSLKQEISTHKFLKGYSKITNWQTAVENLKLFSEELDRFYQGNQEFLEKASQVDANTFAAVERYYKSIRTIQLRTSKVMNESVLSTESINKEIIDATEFQIDLLEAMLDIFKERQDYYINYLYNQKAPKYIIDKFNNHKYIQEIVKNK